MASVPIATDTQEEDSSPEHISSTRHDSVGITVDVTTVKDQYLVSVRSDQPRPLVLHWAVDGWTEPPQALWPPGTVQAGGGAVQTTFTDGRHVELAFPEAQCPQRVVFVLKQTEPEQWMHNGATDFAVMLKPPSVRDIADKVIEAEGTYSHWSLFQRFILANELLDGADAAGAEGMGFLYTWLRLSAQKQLDWYRLSNYQSKDIAHVQKTLTQRMAEKAATASDPWSRLFARLSLAGLPRGGGDGDAIRHGILNVMRENGIREGHRPGLDEPFLEQWHQKLHTNTTPEDVTICEAYLAFLHSGNHDDYWRVLWDNGRITREHLETMSKPLHAWPMHLPHLIGPMQHYLWILKTTHSGADLDTAAEMCKGYLDEDLRWNLFDLLQNRHAWWVPGKLVELRRRLAGYWRGAANGVNRDVVLLDVALDNYFRLTVERLDKSQLSGDDVVEMVTLVLQNATIAGESEDLNQVCRLWERLRGESGRWTRDWALVGLAAAQRAQLSVSAYADAIFAATQPAATRFGAECGVDAKYVANFGEEVVRGQPVFMLSLLLQQLEPMLRQTAGVSNWQVVSQESALGVVLEVASLAEVQGSSFAQPTVILADAVGGMEDIPEGVQAVLTKSATDVLSHVAIRARNQRVLLATCFDDKQWEGLRELTGQHVSVDVAPTGDVIATVADLPSSSGAGNGGATAAAVAPLSLQRPEDSTAWALPEAQFQKGANVGGKSANLALLRSKLPDWIELPRSVALPFGTFERVVAHPSNAAVAKQLKALLQQLEAGGSSKNGAAASKNGVTGTNFEREHSNGASSASVNGSATNGASSAGSSEDLHDIQGANGDHVKGSAPPTGSISRIPAELEQIRQLLRSGKLRAPPELVTEVVARVEEAGVAPAGSLAAPTAWTQLWAAICGVWASKWTERAWLSRRARGVAEGDLYMACLLQQVVPAQYAFVLHTADPLTHAPGAFFGEVVVGMGEALVGNYPGRAFGFSDKPEVEEPIVLSLPSKRSALHSPDCGTIIARSDSNGEDLEGFAGAGLYDSIPVLPLKESTVEAASEALLWDAGFRQQLMDDLVEMGAAVEAAFGGIPQDIEGAWRDGKLTVVQSRPQVVHADDAAARV